LTLALDGGEWLASCTGCFTSRVRAPGTHWTGGWVGLKAILDMVVKRKIPSPCQELNPLMKMLWNATKSNQDEESLKKKKPSFKHLPLYGHKKFYKEVKLANLFPSQTNNINPCTNHTPKFWTTKFWGKRGQVHELCNELQ
jgi:hypothetical protein